MANSLSVKISEDGRRNAIVTLNGIVDTADLNVPRAVLLSSFVNNDVQERFAGLCFKRASFAITAGLSVILAWNGNTPEIMAALSGSAEMDRRREGGMIPNLLASGYEGSINVSTKGFVPGTAYAFTIALRMTKIYRRRNL